jgi:hypothetical protein
MIEEDVKTFRKILMALFKDGRSDLADRAQHLYSVSAIPWFDNEREMRNALACRKGDFGSRLVSLRPPSGLPSEKAVIGMWCAWDFENESPACKIEILISRANGQVFGFRVDPAHPRHKHRYWHVQFTYKFSCQGTGFPQANANCIDDSTPAFPVALDPTGTVTPKDAAVYAIISLYGLEIPNAINAGIRTHAHKLKPSLRALLP